MADIVQIYQLWYNDGGTITDFTDANRTTVSFSL